MWAEVKLQVIGKVAIAAKVIKILQGSLLKSDKSDAWQALELSPLSLLTCLTCLIHLLVYKLSCKTVHILVISRGSDVWFC